MCVQLENTQKTFSEISVKSFHILSLSKETGFLYSCTELQSYRSCFLANVLCHQHHSNT